MALITVRRLDANHDPVCGIGTAAFISDRLAVAQIIDTTLSLWAGEWWEDTTKGVPYLGSGLSRPGSQRQRDVFTLALQTAILGVPYVRTITAVQQSFDQSTRTFSFSCTANTAFGPIPVSYPVGTIY